MDEERRKGTEPARNEPAPHPFQRKKLKERPGFQTRGMRWLYRVLYPYFHCRVRLPEELENSEEPVVFIANHYNVFGPLSFVLSMPLVYNIWMNQELVDQETAKVSLRPGIRRLLPFLRETRVEWLCEKIAAFISYVLRQVGMIPVDRNQPSRLISTMRQSIAALEEGHNLLIFPETGDPEYSLTSVTPFYSGFAMLGRLYYRKTGKVLRCGPCESDEQQHRIRIGELESDDPEAEPAPETERVSETLNRRIREMAAENRGVEKEDSTPVRRTILFFCNLVRLLLLIPLITMLGLGNREMILVFYGVSQGIRILFNAVCNTYASSNRLSFLFSHAVGVMTDTAMMISLAAQMPRMRWLLYTLILNGAVILISNIRTFFRFRRCAGVNYFDTLSANLLCILCLQQILRIPFNRMAVGLLGLAAAIFLIFSAGFSVAFNARIGLEEDQA